MGAHRIFNSQEKPTEAQIKVSDDSEGVWCTEQVFFYLLAIISKQFPTRVPGKIYEMQ